MTKYLISFPGSAMDVSDEDMAAVGEAAHAVIREAKDAGVYVFGGGIFRCRFDLAEPRVEWQAAPRRGHRLKQAAIRPRSRRDAPRSC